MKRVSGVLAVCLVALLGVVPAALAQAKWVRGTVSSVAADTLTVKVGDKEMTFKVDQSTELIARGAGTAMREAQRAGEPGVKFGEFVKPGEGVEVHYTGSGATMTATEIRTGVTARGEGQASPVGTSGTSLRGTVSAMTGNSITVKAAGQETKLTVTPETRVIGTGVGTKTREMKQQGKAPSVMDLVGMGDTVIVTVQGTTASEIRIASKAR